MADYEINVPGNLLASHLTEQNGLSNLVETVLNQILDAQASEQVGAQRYERSDERVAYRNGYRPRQLYTRVGPLTLRVPLLCRQRTNRMTPSFSLNNWSVLCQEYPRGNKAAVP